MSKPIGSGKSSFYGNDLAFLHNRHYSRFVTEAAPGAIRMLRAAGVKRGLICDLGCGGGQLSAALLRAGYEVVGVDLSPAMIRIARRQVKNARFLQGSIAEVNLPRCQAAFAVGEIVNYLGSRSGMTRAFRNIFRALQPGGVFIFDTIGPLAGKMRRVGAHYAPEWALIVEINQDPATQKLVREIHTFCKAGEHYRRTFEIHRLGIYLSGEIAGMLRTAGFKVHSFPGYGRTPLGQGRRVFLARKPTN